MAFDRLAAELLRHREAEDDVLDQGGVDDVAVRIESLDVALRVRLGELGVEGLARLQEPAPSRSSGASSGKRLRRPRR